MKPKSKHVPAPYVLNDLECAICFAPATTHTEAGIRCDQHYYRFRTAAEYQQLISDGTNNFNLDAYQVLSDLIFSTQTNEHETIPISSDNQ